MITVAELLNNHVTLTIESLDRIYLNGYIPNLQTSGQLVSFLTTHRGHPIPSPALFNKIGQQFKASLDQFASVNALTLFPFERKQRKDDIAAAVRASFTGKEGVYLIGVAQEKSNSFKANTNRNEATQHISVSYSRQPVCVNHYYFYLVDEDFGPAFIKVCSYAPYGLRICINGHEWAKRQLEKEGIAFEPLDNGFKSCGDPDRLQQICNSLGQRQILDFLDKWLTRLPLPLTNEDRTAGYDYRLSIWQMEISRTQVFDAPVHGREFFEEVIRENLDLGRPDRVSLVFDRQITKATPGSFRTRVFEDGVHPSLHFEYKSCRVKQYFKENWALRTETTINNPDDFYIGKDLSNLEKLRSIGRDINLRLLEVQHVSQACTLSQSTVENITHATVTPDGQRVPALRFGDPRPMALWSALTLMCHLPQGFSNASLREHVADLLGVNVTYQANQMTYDLRRLRRKKLIERIEKTNRYRLTDIGLKAALFFTKIHTRLFKPASACLADGLLNVWGNNLANAMKQVQLAIEQLVIEAKFDYAA
jgi:hypothetical protein